DLREPLRKVKAFGSLLSNQFDNQLGPVGQDYINRMTSAVGRMDAMIQGLLAYSQVTSKGAPLKNVPLRQVVMEVVTDLEVHISHVNGRIMVHELPTIQADELQMRILFQNLISNALKYHRPEVPPVITITSRKPAKDQSVILVQDNGIGIDMKYADFIFEPFSRLNGKSEYEGTGMGLTICQKIMERHNGAISVTSTPGEGSVFILTFPRGAPNAAV
ncbi:MAG: ATP-binding protein, partial [Anaerolineaceae bacterium]